MPHVSSSGGDDLGSTDEVKVFKDEGDGEDEKRSSENLTEEKSSLIDLTESEVNVTNRRIDSLQRDAAGKQTRWSFVLANFRPRRSAKVFVAGAALIGGR